ncbi:MAG: endolytic transglycosylase MltG [Treponema sp.]|jgi:UPF0755 protein|nr:endolytic transglycosylase MltG [Treponema sp.]
MNGKSDKAVHKETGKTYKHAKKSGKRRKSRFVFKFLSGIISMGIISGAVILAGAAFLNAPPSGSPDLFQASLSFPLSVNSPPAMRLDGNGALIIEVRSGETSQSVGRRLESAGIIRHQYFWNLLARISNDHIRVGTYRIELPASQTTIRAVLTSGEQMMVRVTIPEGLTVRRTAEILENAGVTNARDFIAAASSPEILAAFNIPGDTMEGYLFPDTYLFPLSYPAERVVTAMANNFFNQLARVAPEGLQMSPGELNERVIMASIVEREFRLREEAALMAGVFFRRLEIGMALQSCATVVYVLTEKLGRPHPSRLFYRDLEVVSPFNTYMHRGLPPAPIASPGVTSLLAAFNPIRTDYLFFRLVDPADGRHFFSRTLLEHNRAEALFVRQ